MKKVNILIIMLIAMSMPIQKGCAQTISCPSNNLKAEKELKKYMSKENHIKSVRKNMPITNNAIRHIKSLSGQENKEECRQLISNLDWLKKQKHYSIYKVSNHYFIVLYSLTKDGKFQKKKYRL